MQFLKDGNFSAADASKLGDGLGVPNSKIREFRSENPFDTEDMLMAIINYWLNNDFEKSWDKLANALKRRCNNAVLAGKIQGELPATEEPRKEAGTY